MLDPACCAPIPPNSPSACAPVAVSSSTSAGWRHWKLGRKRIQVRTQELQNLRNTRSKQIGMLKAKGEDVSAVMAEVAGFGEELKSSEVELDRIRGEIEAIALGIPNLPDDSVPQGSDESQNVEQKTWGTPRVRFRSEGPRRTRCAPRLARWRNRWPKLSGSRFTVLRGQLARLHRALAQFMLDLHTNEHGYEETNVPVIVNADSLYGTSQLPKFEEDMFATQLGESRRYLISTSEISLTNIVRDEIVEAEGVAEAHDRLRSLCFRSRSQRRRRERVRGMIRQHQFEKVELVSILETRGIRRGTRAHDPLRGNRAGKARPAVPQVLLCTGDMGFSARKTYDLGSGCCTSQPSLSQFPRARTAAIFRRAHAGAFDNPATGKPELVHAQRFRRGRRPRADRGDGELLQDGDGSITSAGSAASVHGGGAERIA